MPASESMRACSAAPVAPPSGVTRLNALPAGQRQLMTLVLRKLLASSTYAIAGTLEGLANQLEEEHGSEEGFLGALEKIAKAEVSARLKEIKGDREAKEEAAILKRMQPEGAKAGVNIKEVRFGDPAIPPAVHAGLGHRV